MPEISKLLFRVTLGLLLLVISGCATLERLEQNQLELLKQDLTRKPAPHPLVEPVPDFDRAAKNLSQLNANIQHLRERLSAQPGDLNVARELYELLSTRAVVTESAADVDELRELYARPAMQQQTALSPPSLIEALMLLQKPALQVDQQQVAALCRAAIRENENHSGAYLILSRVYVQQSQLGRAMDLLEKASQRIPQHAGLLTELANVFVLQLNAQRCSGDMSLAEDSIRANERALKSSPSDPAISANLATIYRVLNQPERALDYERRRQQLDGSLQGQLALAAGYLHAGRLNQAQAQLQGLLVENGRNALVWETLGDVYLARSNWQKAFDAYTRARRHGGLDSLYGTLRYALSAQMIGRKAYYQDLVAKYQLAVDSSEFDSTLLAYFNGQRSEAELIAASENFCDKTKAYYFIGMRALMENRADKAELLFKKVMLLNDYASYQYVGAKQILQVLAR